MQLEHCLLKRCRESAFVNDVFLSKAFSALPSDRGREGEMCLQILQASQKDAPGRCFSYMSKTLPSDAVCIVFDTGAFWSDAV